MANQCAVKCSFVRPSEYNGRPQFIFRLPDSYSYAEFSVWVDREKFPTDPEPGKVKWYAFGPENYKFTCQARVFLGEMAENYFKE